MKKIVLVVFLVFAVFLICSCDSYQPNLKAVLEKHKDVSTIRLMPRNFDYYIVKMKNGETRIIATTIPTFHNSASARIVSDEIICNEK